MDLYWVTFGSVKVYIDRIGAQTHTSIKIIQANDMHRETSVISVMKMSVNTKWKFLLDRHHFFSFRLSCCLCLVNLAVFLVVFETKAWLSIVTVSLGIIAQRQWRGSPSPCVTWPRSIMYLDLSQANLWPPRWKPGILTARQNGIVLMRLIANWIDLRLRLSPNYVYALWSWINVD